MGVFVVLFSLLCAYSIGTTVLVLYLLFERDFWHRRYLELAYPDIQTGVQMTESPVMEEETPFSSG